jgi:hypothetical protein
LIRLTLISATVAFSMAMVSPGFSEVGTESPPAVAGINIRFPEPLFLGATMNGQIRADKPGRYRAHVRFRVGSRLLVRRELEGKLRTRWSRLRVSLDPDARRKIRGEARRIHRRPIMAIQVKYYLEGKKHFKLRQRDFILSSRSCRFCLSVLPLLGDTETVFVIHGWGWYAGRFIAAHYGEYCAPGALCPATSLITRFRTSRHGRFVFRFRNGPSAPVDVPQPAASGRGPITFEQDAPHHGGVVRRTVHLRVRYPNPASPDY